MKFSKLFDHTLLKPEATEQEISKLCDEAIKYDFASVCVNPCFVPFCSEHLKGTDIKVCTVVGFPLGANEPTAKAAEAAMAVEEGANEIDMVISLGRAKMGDFGYIESEIKRVKNAIGDILLKVILETSALTDEEIVKACTASKNAGAQFVKTSTGFHKTGGASVHAVELMKKTVGDQLEVKASGGIHHLDEVEAMVKAGAARIGCSASVAIMEEYSKKA